MCIDTLVDGVHFDRRTSPRALGHKALAVNLSDIAAVGGRPLAALAGLTTPWGAGPPADAHWLDELATGLLALADAHRVAWRGGRLSAGPLSITVEVSGALAGPRPLTRAGARPGDRIYVTGTLGDAGGALALDLARLPAADRQWLRERLDLPTPRVAAGAALAGLASAAIDLSDGLVSDLGHLVAASRVGAVVECARLPLSPPLRAHAGPRAMALALSAGDDYELLFTLPPASEAALDALAPGLGCPVTRIGEIGAATDPAVRWLDPAGRPFTPRPGFVHF